MERRTELIAIIEANEWNDRQRAYNNVILCSCYVLFVSSPDSSHHPNQSSPQFVSLFCFYTTLSFLLIYDYESTQEIPSDAMVCLFVSVFCLFFQSI